jgi:hypothetical protein
MIRIFSGEVGIEAKISGGHSHRATLLNYLEINDVHLFSNGDDCKQEVARRYSFKSPFHC